MILYFGLVPPPWCLTVILPLLFLPACFFRVTVRDFSGVVAVISSEGTGDEAETEIYLVTGDKKGSSKYDRADRLSYTDSVRYTAEAVELLDRYGLRITRNEIYARHGRMFNDQDMQDYFNRQAWYVPRTSTGSFDESCLNEIETYNVKLIRSYELKQGY